MKSHFHLGLLLSAGTSALLVAMPAQAQSSAQDTSARSTIAEIVVTARRREESIQNVPVAIAALSGANLESKMLRTTDDLKNFVPSLNINGLKREDFSNFYIRRQGPGSLTTGQRNFSSVATYFAEVPTTIAGPGVFYDLANVQFLKGPQGTLFGRNTTGGAVLFEPAARAWENSGFVQFQFGSYSMKQFDGVINVMPVPDKIGIRAAVEIARREGFMQSIYTGQELDNRHYEDTYFSIRLAPVEGFESTTIVNYRNRDQSGTSQVTRALDGSVELCSVGTTPGLTALAALTPLVGLTPAQVPGIPLTVAGNATTACLSAPTTQGSPAQLELPPGFAQYGGIAAALRAAYEGGGLGLVALNNPIADILARLAIGPRKTRQMLLGIDKAQEWSVTNPTTANITDDITLKNVISFQKARQQFQYGFDGTPLALIDSLRAPNARALASEQITEFQVQRRIPSAKIGYILGGYYKHENPGFDQVNPSVQVGQLSYRFFNHLNTSKTVFVHLEWNPIPLVSVSGSVRQAWDSRVSSISKSVVFPATFPGDYAQDKPGINTSLCPIEYSGKYKALTYDATLSLHPVQGLLIYASYRHGYKSGGFNLPAPDAPPPLAPEACQKYDPKFVNEIEGGAKSPSIWTQFPFSSNGPTSTTNIKISRFFRA